MSSVLFLSLLAVLVMHCLGGSAGALVLANLSHTKLGSSLLGTNERGEEEELGAAGLGTAVNISNSFQQFLHMYSFQVGINSGNIKPITNPYHLPPSYSRSRC